VVKGAHQHAVSWEVSIFFPHKRKNILWYFFQTVMPWVLLWIFVSP
jgi:hypothetical protein